MKEFEAWIVGEVKVVVGIAVRAGWMALIAEINQRYGFHLDPVFVQTLILGGVIHKAVTPKA